MTCEEVFSQTLDITRTLTKGFLQKLAPFIKDVKEEIRLKNLLNNDVEWKTFEMEKYRVAHVFTLFTSLKIDFKSFVDLLEPIQPRW